MRLIIYGLTDTAGIHLAHAWRDVREWAKNEDRPLPPHSITGNR